MIGCLGKPFTDDVDNEFSSFQDVVEAVLLTVWSEFAGAAANDDMRGVVGNDIEVGVRGEVANAGGVGGGEEGDGSGDDSGDHEWVEDGAWEGFGINVVPFGFKWRWLGLGRFPMWVRRR